MSETIVCVTEEEPAGFHPAGKRGLSVRLSVATEETDEALARDKVLAVLDAFATVRFAVFAEEEGTWHRLADDKVELVADDLDDSLSGAFRTWLADYTSDAPRRFFAKAGQDTLAASVGAATPIERSAANADAHDVILGIASQTAPVPQSLHLAFVLRLTLDGDLSSATTFLVVPLVDGAAIDDPVNAGIAAGEQVRIDYVAPVDKNPASILRCSTTVTKPVAAPSTLIELATCFVVMYVPAPPRDPEVPGDPGQDRESPGALGQEAATQRPEAELALRRFEARAGSLFNAALALAEIAWPAIPEPPIPGNDEAAQEAKRKEAAAFAGLVVRRLAWKAVTTLSASLDTILIALAMPGRDRRDGALLAPFLSLLQTGIDRIEPEKDGRRGDLRAALRDGLAGLEILKLPGTEQTVENRRDFVDALSAACSIEPPVVPKPADGDWLAWLLHGYVEHHSATEWKDVVDRGLAFAPPGTTWDLTGRQDRAAFASALDRELSRRIGNLYDMLTSDKGLESTILRLLGLEAVRSSFASAIKGKLASDAPIERFADAYRAAFEQFGQQMATSLKGADAARQAAGSLLADLLVMSASTPGRPLTRDALTLRMGEWAYWARRFERPATGPGAEVMAALARPVRDPENYFGVVADMDGTPGLPDDTGQALAAIDEAAAGFRASVLAELFPPETARFAPDAAPRGLPVQIAVDPSADDEKDAEDEEGADDEEDVDTFSAAFAGLALLIKGRSGWAYGNLAEVTVPKLSEDPLAAPTILPLPTTLSDGRRELFVTYDGRPFATSAFDLSVPGSENVTRRERFLTTDYPRAPAAGAHLPPLAYGVTYTVAAHAVGRSGSLPLSLQGGKPWVPEHPLTPPEDTNYLLSLPYSRTTAIGWAAIVEPEATRRIGVVPEGVRPLSFDYPRLALAVGGSPLELFRNPDGGGAITVPAIGESASLDLHDVRLWSGVARLLIDVLAVPNAEPGQPGIVRDETGDPDLLDVTLPDHLSHRLTLRITRENASQASISVEVDGTEASERALAIDDPKLSLWLRLRLEGAEGVAFALADPAGSAATGRQDPEDLLLLGGGADKTVWRPPFNGKAGEAFAEIVFPRVGALDFERWISNQDLRNALFRGADSDLVTDFRRLLLAAEIERAVKPERARFLDRLPDPAVGAIEIEVAPLDGLRDEPSRLAGSAFPVRRERIAVPRIAATLNKPAQKANIGARDIGAVLAAIDAAFRVKLQITSEEFAAGTTRWIEPPPDDGKPWTIRVPTGMTAALTVRILVPESHFAGTDDLAETIDRRLRQLAIAKGQAHAGEPCLLFEGARLRIEAMTGPLEATADVSRPWQTTRAAWIDLVQALVRHEPAGKARVYDLAATPPRDPEASEETWRWRQLASIDVATQRWRFMGRPIYSWFDPKKKLADGRGERAVGALESVSARLYHDDEIEEFEQEAFEDRDDRDSELQTAILQPFGTRSRLVTIPWERPSATLFRHRFTLVSRYAGAMARRDGGLCDAWPEWKPDGEHTAEDRRRNWLRIVMLADRSRIALTRPQLRALIPLTASPEEGGGRAPPVLAIIQERPFDWGGLADRVAAEIRTAIGYRLDGAEDGREEGLVPGDARREIGPDPRLSYSPFDEDAARRAVLVPEGPIGLTFDDSASRAPAFPNTAMILQPSVLEPDEALIAAAPASLEEHFLSVSLRRYLDPGWLADEPSATARFDRCWWCAFPPISVIPPPVYRGSSRRSQDPTLPPEERRRLVASDGAPMRMTFAAESGSVRLDVLRCFELDHFVEVTLDRSAIDPTIDTQSGNKANGPTHDHEALILCRIPADRGTVAFLHMPLDERRATLAIFLVPHPSSPRSGSGTLPLLCASIAWSIPKGFSASGFRLSPEIEIHPVEASEATAMNWVRTNRDFETVWGILPGKEPARIQVARLQGLLTDLSGGKARLSFVPLDDNAAREGAWIRARQATEPFPTHAQRHVAALLSKTLPGYGRETERLSSAHLVQARTLDLGKRPDRVRIIEFEVPAAIIGWMPTIAHVPVAYRFARFDLTAIGFGGKDEKEEKELYLSYFVRLIGSSAALGALTSFSLMLRADSAEPDQAIRGIKIAVGSQPLAAIILDVVVADKICQSLTGQKLDVTGTVAQIPLADLPAPNQTLLDGATQGLVLSFDGAPHFSGGGGHEIWLEIAMLASRRQEHGFRGKLDFDWFFGPEPTPTGPAVKERDLRTLPEAQARVVAVSPPLPPDPTGPG